MGKADDVIAISESLYNKYEQLLIPEKLHMVYNEIDEKQFLNVKKQIFRQEIIELGIIGGVVPRKGQEELIHACRILKKRGISGFRLRIVAKGKVKYWELLERLVEGYGLEEQVFFIGAKENRQYADNRGYSSGFKSYGDVHTFLYERVLG